MEKIEAIKEAGAALAALLEEVSGPLADRAKALVAEATGMAVQSVVVQAESNVGGVTPPEFPPVEPPVEPPPVEPPPVDQGPVEPPRKKRH